MGGRPRTFAPSINKVDGTVAVDCHSGAMLIGTKLAPPNRMTDAARRDALVERITSDTRRVTVLSAPAGYGKTTLLSQCHARWREGDVAVAWYSADDSRFEADQFFAYVMAALHRSGLPLPYSADAIAAGLPGLAVDAAARAVVVALEASEEPVRLIVDDYHRIASPTLDGFLDYVIERMPDHAAIVLALRGTPGIALARLRVRGQLLHLEQDDIRFTDAEMLAVLGGEAEKVDSAEVIARTQGWPAALQLLRLWLEGRDRVEALTHLTRRSSDLADYLAEQVFADLSPDVQAFLLETSVAERICAGLGTAITGREDSAALLDGLRRRNTLVTSLDEEGTWLRVHPLLREFLSDRLDVLHGERRDELHLSAATWLAGHNLLSEALNHAARMADRNAALRIMETAGGWQVALRGGSALLRHLDAEGVVCAETYPRVTLGRAYLAAQEGRLATARALLDRLMAVRPLDEVEQADPGLAVQIVCNDLVTHIYEDRPIPDGHVAFLRRRLDAPSADPVLGVLIRHLTCLAHFDRGDMAWCRVEADSARKLARVHNLPLIEVYAHQYLGLAQMRAGHRREAELFFRRGLELARRNFGEGSVQVAVAIVLLAHTRYLAGDLSNATDLLETTLPLIEQGEGWHEVFFAGYATQGWIAIRTGNFALAERVLQQGRDTAARRGLVRLQYQLSLLRVRILLSSNRLDLAQDLLREIGPPAAEMAQRDARLPCEHAVATLCLALQRGTCDPAALEKLSQMVAEVGSMALEVEALVLLAAAYARRRRVTEAARAFRQALELTESEDLIGVISQFGALLPVALGDCEEALNLFEPAQRAVVSRLHRSTRGGPQRSAAIPPAAGDVIITPREVDVLRALADGLSSKEIARSLGVAESTIKTHRINIYRKLDVATRSRAIQAARNLRLI